MNLSSLSQIEREITSIGVFDTLQGLKGSNKSYSNDMYGWDKVDGALAKNELEQKMLRKIYKMNTLGYTYTEIAKFLNEKGYKTNRGGKKYYYSTVEYILKSK